MDENLVAKRNELKKLMLPLEWDERLKQLHYAREMKLKVYRQELEVLEKEIENGKTV